MNVNEIKLSRVIQSHLNDMMVEVQIGNTEGITNRIRFIKYLLLQNHHKPLSDVRMDEDELNELWIKLYREVEQ